jgi:hypothetical protein
MALLKLELTTLWDMHMMQLTNDADDSETLDASVITPSMDGCGGSKYSWEVRNAQTVEREEFEQIC